MIMKYKIMFIDEESTQHDEFEDHLKSIGQRLR